MGLTISLAAALAAIAASCSVQPPEAEKPGQSEAALSTNWLPTTQMPEQRRYHSATVLTSDKVLVVGGWSYGGLTRNASTYDPASETWSPAGELTLAREAHTATRLPSGKVLVVGGETFLPPTGYTHTAELYDPATNSWSDAGAMSEARGYNTATLLSPSNKVLVVGGLRGGPQRAVDLYDVATDTWSVAAPLLEPRHSHTAVWLASSGKVLVAGGWAGGALESTELYEPTTNTWSPGQPLTTARYGHTATELPNGKILVVGGRKDSVPGTMEFTETAELYDPSTQTWTPAASLVGARGFHTATLVAGKVLVSGGRGPGDVALATAEVYDPSTNKWSITDSMLGARSDHAAVYSTPLGKVLVLGGSTHAPLETAEAYDACKLLTCNTPPPEQCYVSVGTCSTGTCSYARSSAGTPCDDGNASTTGDTCDAAGACTGCGDGVKNGSETCDDGNTVTETACPYGQTSCTACNATCTAALPLSGPYCGDRARNGPEACDDGNTTSETSCPYGQPSCTRCNATCTAVLNIPGSYCGDGAINGPEACDDGNNVTENSCPYGQASCTVCNATCTGSVYIAPPPANCSSTTLSWSQSQPAWNGNPSTAGTYTCSGTVPAASHGATNVTAFASGSARTGSAKFTCNNGAWTPASGSTPTCDGGYKNLGMKCSSSNDVEQKVIGWYLTELKRCADTNGLKHWLTIYNPTYMYNPCLASNPYGSPGYDACFLDLFHEAASSVGEFPEGGHVAPSFEASACDSSAAYPWTNVAASGTRCKYRP